MGEKEAPLHFFEEVGCLCGTSLHTGSINKLTFVKLHNIAFVFPRPSDVQATVAMETMPCLV